MNPKKIRSKQAWRILAAVLATASISSTATTSIEDLAPHLSTHTPIIWKAPTNLVPKSLWVYRMLPNAFTEPVISNAVVLASFQSKGFPRPSTNRITLWDHYPADVDDPFVGSFSILPDIGEIVFDKRNHAAGSSEAIPSDEMIMKRAWDCVAQLGIDPAQLSQGRIQNNGCEYDDKGGLATNGYVCGRTITLLRRLDGVDFQDESEGFTIEFGSHGEIRSFGLNWPNLERSVHLQTLSPEQIIRLIRANKTPVFPNDDEQTFFQRIKLLSRTKTFTVTNMVVHYGQGTFGIGPKENEMPKFINPYAELLAVADLGNSNITVRLAAPIVSSDANRLLGREAK